MNIYRSFAEIPNFKNAVVTIGSFDGVHTGHQKLIDKVSAIAKEVAGEAIVVTFHPHPRSIVFPHDTSLALLTDIDEKIQLLKKAGVQNLIIVPFTVDFSQITAQEYVTKFLVDALKVKYLIVGYDHKFGVARQGDFHLLKYYEKQGLFKVIEIEKQMLDDIDVSSTNIRKAIQSNQFDQAIDLLGNGYLIRGKVVKGDSIGTTIGYPTANIKPDIKNKLIPAHGIYACFVYIKDQKFKGMLYIGPRPTIADGGASVIEVNIFDFNDNIYNEYLTLEIVAYLRGDQKFDSLNDLKLQLDSDRLSALNYFTTIKGFTNTEPLVNVAILNYNGEAVLQKYLPSVVAFTPKNFKITLIDNASTDESIALVKKQYPQVEIISLVKNHGFAGGYNKGLDLCLGKYTVFLNSDVEVTQNWLDPMIALLESDTSIGAVQPKIRSTADRLSFEYAGASGGYIDALAYPFCRGRVLDTIEEDNGQYDDATEVFWTSGAAMIIPTTLFKNFGGFDEEFFAHQEEIDLCWRIKRAGYKCMVVPNSIVYHQGGGSLSYGNPQKTYLNFRNNLYMVLKNTPMPQVIFVFFMRLILDGVAGLTFLIRGKSRDMLAVIRAHFACYKKLPDLIHNRVKTNESILKNKIDSQNLIGLYKGSILLKYYLLGKKKYNQL